MLRRLALILALSAATLTAFQWSNQKKAKPRDPNSRNVEGVVSLPDGAPAVGAVVQLKNLKNLQVRSYITQEKGTYTFQNLSTSVDYELAATFKDMASPKRSLTIFDTRQDAIVNLKLEPRRQSEDAEQKKDGKQ